MKPGEEKIPLPFPRLLDDCGNEETGVVSYNSCLVLPGVGE
jgi:hypothetical protein